MWDYSADTNVKIMKLNQEEMCRLHSRVKTKTMYDIVIVICKSFLSCIRVIKLWKLMPSSYFWGLQCSPKLMVAVWLDSNCESLEIWDVPWCTSEILTPWHLRTSASWCPWSSMLFIRTKRSFFENCYSEASTCGIATARRWQTFRIFRKWSTNSLHTTFRIPIDFLMQDFQCIRCLGQDTISGAPFGMPRFCLAQFVGSYQWQAGQDPSKLDAEPNLCIKVSSSDLDLTIWWNHQVWMFKFSCWILSHFSFHGHAMFYLFAASFLPEDGRSRRSDVERARHIRHALRVQKQLRWHQTRMFEAEGLKCLKRRRGD